jgi:excisionase family DNA binding protein
MHPFSPDHHTVYELTRSRRLPFIKVGRRTLFVRLDLEAWVADPLITPRR